MSPDAPSTATLLQTEPVGGLTATDPFQLTAQLLGIGIAAATAAGIVALAYRWYVRERVPTGLGVLFGLTVVAVSLGTTGALGAVIAQDDAVLAPSYVLPNLAAFAIGAAGSTAGIRAGDAVATDLFATTSRAVDADVSEIVQTVGRVTAVKLPGEIDDIVGYDPVPEATKATLADRRFLFPRRLTKAELRDRLVSRLKTDYGVGHVDVELGDDGTVDYIAVGSRAAGIGPTLPPATNAVAIRADPANAASSGDLVQVWQTDPPERVLTGELRGVAGDVVTVAIDAGDTPKLDPSRQYKLVTLPVQDRPDREFASLLRAADETMETVTVVAGSELVGTTVGELRVTVAAITREDSPPVPIPSRDRVLEAGDVIYAIAKPDALRYTETAATRQREPPVEAGGSGGDEPAGDGPTETADSEADDEPSAGETEPATAPEDGEPTAERDGQATDRPDADPADGDDGQAADQPDAEPAEEAGESSTEAGDTEEELIGEAEPTAAEEPDADENRTTDGESDTDAETGATAGDDETVTVWDPDEKLAEDDSEEATEETPAEDDPLKSGFASDDEDDTERE